MPSKTIHIVQGATGEWDDFCHWNVRAFSSKKEAKAFIQKLAPIADKCHTLVKYGNEWEREMAQLRKLDLGVCMDYNGTKYTINQLKLITPNKD